MINHILAASRVPWILEQKGIDIKDLMGINMNDIEITAQFYNVEDILKFDNWEYKPYEKPVVGIAGRLVAEFEGIKFISCISEKELSLIES